MNEFRNFSDLVGETLTQVIGLQNGSNEINFACKSGKVFRMYHSQECCENVVIEDLVGDVSDIVNGKPINLAEQVSNPEPYKPDTDSYTWTFYRIQAGECIVTIRWLGTSNGFYSETVKFSRLR